jgi:hypothetical protein
MLRASTFNAVSCPYAGHDSSAGGETGLDLGWSPAKLRVAGLVLIAAAGPAFAGFALGEAFVKCLALAWLAGIAALMQALGRRALADGPVLTIGERGILDCRLMPGPIGWHEIEAVCPVDIGRSHVVEIILRHPRMTLAHTSWPVKIGIHCQLACDIPAVTVSVLLLEGDVRDVLNAIGRHRPDLLHPSNRAAPLMAGR